jgi:hypothetical protein
MCAWLLFVAFSVSVYSALHSYRLPLQPPAVGCCIILWIWWLLPRRDAFICCLLCQYVVDTAVILHVSYWQLHCELVLWNVKVHCCVLKSSRQDLQFEPLCPFCNFTPYFFKVCFNIVLLSMSVSQVISSVEVFWLKSSFICHLCHVSHLRYMSHCAAYTVCALSCLCCVSHLC